MANFELATRKKFLFESSVGNLTVMDLWDLPLTSAKNRPNLDDVAKTLHKQLKNDDDVSFVNPANKSDETVQAKFDIVIHIINVKQAEAKARDEAAARAAQKQKLLEIIDRKQGAELEGKSIEALRKELEALS